MFSDDSSDEEPVQKKHKINVRDETDNVTPYLMPSTETVADLARQIQSRQQRSDELLIFGGEEELDMELSIYSLYEKYGAMPVSVRSAPPPEDFYIGKFLTK